MPHRVWLAAAGASVWLSMMITPQGEGLFLEVWPTLATAAASIAATYAVLGFESGRERDHPDDGPLPLPEPALPGAAVAGAAVAGAAVAGAAVAGAAVAGAAVAPAAP
jgi:hypothetical protein